MMRIGEVTPNKLALEMLRDIAQMKVGMKETDGSETDRLLREARSGAMYRDHEFLFLAGN